MATKYAASTDVSEDRSIQEIRRELQRFGASGFMYGEDDRGRRRIAFDYEGLRVQFDITLPDLNDDQFKYTATGNLRTREPKERLHRGECRRLWRSLAFVIKAKLVAIADGVSTFEREFLAFIVLPDGSTIGDQVAPNVLTIASSADLAPLIGRSPAIALGAGN